MPAVRMVQMAVYQIIDVVAVGDRFMSAARPVHMVCRVGRAIMATGACSGIAIRYGKRVLVIVAFMRMMQVAVMQVVHMAVVQHRGVPATGAVDVVVLFVYVMVHDCLVFLDWDFASGGCFSVA